MLLGERTPDGYVSEAPRFIEVDKMPLIGAKHGTQWDVRVGMAFGLGMLQWMRHIC